MGTSDDPPPPRPVPGQIPAGSLMERLGLEFLELSPDRVVARIPVKGNTQPYGLIHGGATAALCETVGSVGTAVAIGPDRRTVGLTLSVNHLRTVRTGHITATGEPVHIGDATAVWDVEVRNDDGKLVAVARVTMAVRHSVPG
jgi:uncharacterized protein (TIGR00369 family)